MNLINLVQRLIATTTMPVAIGSSVPACPTFLIPVARLTSATRSCEVRPEGLSRTRNPSTIDRVESVADIADHRLHGTGDGEPG